MKGLPIELITKILDRVPVKSLLRFRCVSKRWRDTIDSPRFVKSHLSRSIESSTDLSVFLRHSSSLYRIDLGSLGGVVEMNYPLACYGDEIKVLGSCHGLLCMSNAANDVAIWNPSTGKQKLLPRSVAEIRPGVCSSFCVHGFGYDDTDDDYILLRLIQTDDEPIESEVWIYNLKSNTWKLLGEIPYTLVYRYKMGVFACSRLHWIMTQKREPVRVPDSPNMLVAFDVHSKDFRELVQPDVIDNKLAMDLAVLGGCLCLSIINDDIGFDVWIMKEYGLKESWAKLFTIPQSEVGRPLGFAQPLAYSQNGRQVLVRQDSKNLVWYNLETGCIEKVNVRGTPSSFEAEICLITLVSVEDYGCTKKKKKNRNARDDLLPLFIKLAL